MPEKRIVQLYISDKNGTPDRPVKELKGFHKGDAGSRRDKDHISGNLCKRPVVLSRGTPGWYAPSGRYEIAVGHASDDIRLTKEISFETKKQLPFRVDGQRRWARYWLTREPPG